MSRSFHARYENNPDENYNDDSDDESCNNTFEAKTLPSYANNTQSNDIEQKKGLENKDRLFGEQYTLIKNQPNEIQAKSQHQVKQEIKKYAIWKYVIAIVLVGLLTYSAVFCIQFVTDYKSTYNRLKIMYERILDEPTLSQIQKQKLTENHPFRPYLQKDIINGYSALCIGLILSTIVALGINVYILFAVIKNIRIQFKSK